MSSRFNLQLDNAADPVDASHTVKSLGVLYDQFLTFEDQVNSIISSATSI